MPTIIRPLKIDSRENYFMYPNYPFSNEVITGDIGDPLNLFPQIFTCDEELNPLIPYVNNDSWLMNNFVNIDEGLQNCDVFAQYFISKYRNYKMNYVPYKHLNYMRGGTIYKFSYELSNWWTVMYEDMACDIINMINNNRRKYERLFNLFSLEYNPLWNVDGTEERTTEHSGTSASSGTNTNNNTSALVTSFNDFVKSNEKTISDILNKEGTETDLRTLNTALTYLGTETNTKNGTETHQNATTSFNSDTDYDTTKETISYNNLTDSKSYTNRSDTNTGTDSLVKSFNDRNDSRSLTESDSETYTGTKTDTNTTTSTETSSNSGTDTYANTDSLVRQGNIGVTSSQNLYNQELELLSKIVLYDELAHDIASEFLILNKGV